MHTIRILYCRRLDKRIAATNPIFCAAIHRNADPFCAHSLVSACCSAAAFLPHHLLCFTRALGSNA